MLQWMTAAKLGSRPTSKHAPGLPWPLGQPFLPSAAPSGLPAQTALRPKMQPMMSMLCAHGTLQQGCRTADVGRLCQRQVSSAHQNSGRLTKDEWAAALIDA